MLTDLYLLWKAAEYICESVQIRFIPGETGLKLWLSMENKWHKAWTTAGTRNSAFSDDMLLCFIPSYNFCWAAEGCFRYISPHELCVWAIGKTLNYSFGSATESNPCFKMTLHFTKTWCAILYDLAPTSMRQIAFYSEINECMHLGASGQLITKTDMSQPHGRYWGNHMAAETREWVVQPLGCDCKYNRWHAIWRHRSFSKACQSDNFIYHITAFVSALIEQLHVWNYSTIWLNKTLPLQTDNAIITDVTSKCYQCCLSEFVWQIKHFPDIV